MKTTLFVLFSSIALGCFSQQDPYLKKLGVYNQNKSSKATTIIVDKLNKTIKDSVYANSPKAESYCWTALSLAGKSEYAEGQVETMLNMSRAKIYLNETDSALTYANGALAIANRIKSDDLIIKSYDMKGTVYTYRGVYDKAVDEYFNAIKLAEKVDVKLAVRSYANVGHVFMKIGNTNKFTQYVDKSYRLSKKYKDTTTLITTLNLMGLADKNNGKPEEGLKHFEEGLKYARETDNLKRQSEILYNMSNIYFRRKEYDKGFELFNESIAISKSNGSYKSIAISYHSLGMNHHAAGNIKKALIAADSALHYALLSENYEIIMETYALQAQLTYDNGNADDAVHYLSYAYVYKDSLNLAALNDAVLNAEDMYEAEKDSLQTKLKLENEQKINDEKLWWRDILLWVSGFVLVVVCIGIYLVLKSNKQIKLKNRTVENQKEEIFVQHKEITDSITYAQKIQQAMISNDKEWSAISNEHSIFFKPKDVVSGDFYWAHNTADKNFSIWAVADCTGHGVPGAFMSMLGIGFLNEIVIENKHLDPGAILDSLRNKIIAALEKEGESKSKDGMDISICVWNRKDNTLAYAGANNGLWLIRDRSDININDYKSSVDDANSNLSLVEIAPDKMPVGNLFAIPPPFSTKKLQLINNDLIVLFTDGFADQFGGPDDKKYKSKQLKEDLLTMQSKPISEHEPQLNKRFEEWKGGNEQIDDVCIVSVRIQLG